MLAQGDGELRTGELRLGRGYGGVGLAHAAARFQAIGAPIGGELLAGEANVERTLLHLRFVIEARQIGIGVGDAGGEREPRLTCVDLRRARIRRGRRERRLVLAPQVEVEIEVERHAPGAEPALRHEFLGQAHIIALLGGVGARVQISGRERRGAGLLRHRLGLAEARGGDRHVGGVPEPLLDQCGELRIAIGGPPVIRRPGGLRRAQALLRFDALRRANRGFRTQIGNRGAARQQHRHRRRQHRAGGKSHATHRHNKPYHPV